MSVLILFRFGEKYSPPIPRNQSVGFAENFNKIKGGNKTIRYLVSYNFLMRR